MKSMFAVLIVGCTLVSVGLHFAALSLYAGALETCQLKGSHDSCHEALFR